MASALAVQNDPRRIQDGVIVTELLEHLRAGGLPGVGYDDAVVGAVAGAHAPETDLQHD
jgi:hypothetical protein